MKVIGLLSWFAEPTDLLIDCITAMAQVGVDHIVAVDGRYKSFPAKQHISPPNEHAAIVFACRETGMGLTLSIPSGPWENNEVEKRTALFALGWTVAQEGDWFWVQDADQIVKSAPKDWKRRLAETEHDAAMIVLHDELAAEDKSGNYAVEIQVRSLFRAQPMHVDTYHARYISEDGRLLWGMMGRGEEVPALDMGDIHVEHRSQDRIPERVQAKRQYYHWRDSTAAEYGDCECGEPAVKLVARSWRMSDDGRAIAQWHEACASHAPRWEYDARWQLKKLAEAEGLEAGTAGDIDIRTGVRNHALPAKA